jgi:ABC-type polysaccharide/polyol phosphate export permease
MQGYLKINQHYDFFTARGRDLIRSLKELWKRNELIKYLVVSNLKTTHKGTVLGYFWWLLEPLLLMGVYFLLVSVIFKRGGQNYPIFLFCALLPWQFFTKSISQSVDSIASKAQLMKQIAFPKGVLPLSAVLSNFVNFLFGAVILFIMLLLYKIKITWWALLFFPLILLQLMFTIGFAFFLSCFSIYFRDIKFAMRFVLRIWFYLSPGLYPLSLVPEKYYSLYLINPFAVFFNSYREVLMNGTSPNFSYVGVAFLISTATFLAGAMYFTVNEKKIVKIV